MQTPRPFIQFYRRAVGADGLAEISQTTSLCQSVSLSVGDCISVCVEFLSVGVSSSELSAWHNVGAMIDG